MMFLELSYDLLYAILLFGATGNVPKIFILGIFG